MGSMSDRLRRLEDRTGASRVDEGVATTREVLSRMSVEELRAYVSALRRMTAEVEPSKEDGPILRRVKELYEEVRNGN